ncbi:TPA: inovirus-type Gp2 protein [Yersinia enterocolitica]|nr:inovirus Gp2 family protein [Yersinia enterocolitica]
MTTPIEAFTPAIRSRLLAVFKRRKKKNPGKYVHRSDLHFIWVRENNQYGEKIHYHALLMFNRDAFWRLGEYQKKGSLADLITQTRLSVLKLNTVLWSRFRKTLIITGATDDCLAVLQRIDYMVKHRTKQYSNKVRTLECSVSAQRTLDGD